MMVVCEECGKKYRVDSSKITGKAASFKCHICSHVIVVYKTPLPPPQPDSEPELGPTTTTDDRPAGIEDNKISVTPTTEKVQTGTRHHHGKAGGVGLRAKMLLLLGLIPLILTAGSSLFYLRHFEITAGLIVQETTHTVSQLAEKKISNPRAATATMQSRAKELTDKARKSASLVLGGTLLVMGIIVFIYVLRLTGKIKSLAEVAERISAGELELEIEPNSSDEIGKLAKSIARMQENMRLSVERLKRRR